MQTSKSKLKNSLYFAYRIVSPLVDPLRLYLGLTGYPRYIRDLVRYKRMDPSASLLNGNIYPIVHEKTTYTPFDAHYFYQQIWAFGHIMHRRPKRHVDIGSKYEMSGYLSHITHAVFVDIRPIRTSLKHLQVIKGDILHLPFRDNSLGSVSCLHVAEHIGLGRYGDALDPDGTRKACAELKRVLSYGGRLYFSVPVGRARICFNAHRVLAPETILGYFDGLKLLEFSVVDDLGRFRGKADWRNYTTIHYGCGLFSFTKNA
ncbi:DUF268 domain-containing protein [Patescibacteria group bacterium]|nr:DUF268 domain-containing protein [Patescibacteria group bacterium]